jgi:hypothetical protein
MREGQEEEEEEEEEEGVCQTHAREEVDEEDGVERGKRRRT